MHTVRRLAVVAMAVALFTAAEGAASADTGGAPPRSGAVPQVRRPSESAAVRLNRMIMGDEVQDANNAAAANPRAAELRERGQPVPPGALPPGRASMQPEGRTSMQPGENVPPPPEPSGFGRAVRDVTQSVDRPGAYNPFAIELNPLGLFLGGRLSFGLEWVPVTHHAVVMSPHVVHATADVATSANSTVSQAFSGVGGEIGYRYYTGHRGMNGLFVGPSLIGGVYNAGLPNGNQGFTNVGLAVDAGMQDILWDHLVVGGGIGIEYLAVSHDFADLPAGPSTVAATGFKPRLLLQAGYAF
jgi:hypothetical protein